VFPLTFSPTLVRARWPHFQVRDFSEVRNEAALKYLPQLRKRINDQAPSQALTLLSSFGARYPRFALDPSFPRAPFAVCPACRGLSLPYGDPNDAAHFLTPGVLNTF